MKKIDISKILFYCVVTITLVGSIFGFGFYSGAHKTAVFEAVRDFTVAIAEAIKVTTEEASTLTKTYPRHLLQPSRNAGDGVTINDMESDQSDLILLSGFFDNNNELRLIRRDGTIVRKWTVYYSQIFPNPDHITFRDPPATDWNVDLHGALALPDGSVVFNFEYAGLVKLNRCGKVEWALSEVTHHSVERAEGGGFWVPGRRFYPEGSESPFPPYASPFTEDTILKVSEDGQVLAEISVPGILFQNGLEALLTSTGHRFHKRWPWQREIVHLNDIEELSSEFAGSFPKFQSGDLLISLRDLNLLMVIDPNTSRIKWRQTGPWLRQHDPEFSPSGEILVFNNNMYWADYQTGRVSSNIMETDPENDTSRVIFGQGEDQTFAGATRGKQQITRGGGLLITEFEGGRVFQIDKNQKIIWEYVNRYNDELVAEITEARIYDSSYFEVPNWSCEE